MRNSGRAVALLISLSLSAASCGSQDGSARAAGLERMRDLASTYAYVQKDAQRLTDTFRGTVVDRAAAEYLVDFELNNPTKMCMSRSGFDWDPPELRAQNAPLIEAFGDSVWLREPLRRIASQQVQLSAPFLRAEEAGRSYQPQPGETAAVIECLGDPGVKVASDDELHYASPAKGLALHTTMLQIVDEVDAQLAPRKDYATCMHAAGTEIQGDDGGGSGGFHFVSERLQSSERPSIQHIPLPGEPRTAAWTAYLDTEAEVLEDDAFCRVNVYGEGMRAIAPKLARFAAVHEDDLNDLEKYWGDVRAQAAAKGFVPTPAQLAVSTN